MNFLFAIKLTSIILQGSIIYKCSENYTQILNPVVDRRVMGAKESRTAPMMQNYDIQIRHYRSHTD